ncbi:MAG: class I SAM-dependent DNA methyltransferase [Desulfonatronovibrionaceae bacterium]
MGSKESILEKVYNPADKQDLMAAYSDWAGEYDRDTVDEFGYVGFKACAEVLDRHLQGDPEVRVLDAGCGTGLVAEILWPRGYMTMDGLDYSREMLDQAERKGVYANLLHVDLTRPLDIEDNAYGAIVCAGTLTYGHVGPEVFSEFIRITRPGGVVCFTIREGAYEEYGFRNEMLRLETEGAWELLEMLDTEYYKGRVGAKICVYRIS